MKTVYNSIFDILFDTYVPFHTQKSLYTYIFRSHCIDFLRRKSFVHYILSQKKMLDDKGDEIYLLIFFSLRDKLVGCAITYLH